ncbi:PEGA domain-containing protein [Sorangium sp. So ce315]|uniref:PEGA domain-containing protein n=1 Tax=Sorangium sp. So ce315 TaxID=3133299 RepID=UPI003F60F868
MVETTTSPPGKHLSPAAPTLHLAGARRRPAPVLAARAAAGLALVAAVTLGGATARAQQQPARDPVAAEALFKAARALVDKGDYEAGCPKFEASLALNPSASTMINIARCHEHEGKLATAWHDYHRALVLNRETAGEQRRRGLEELARKGLVALEPRVPKLRIVVEGAPPGVEVQRDGTPLPAAALGEALPIDPGQHEIRASAPGHQPETRAVTLTEGETATIELTLRPAPASAPAAAAPAASAPAAANEASGGRVPAWAWISGAAGLALAGASVGFLIDDLSAIGALRDNCREAPGGTYCNPGYDYAADNARKNRDLALFVGLGGAGLVALGVAAFGIVRAGGEDEAAPARAAVVTPWIGPSGAGAGIAGSF